MGPKTHDVLAVTRALANTRAQINLDNVKTSPDEVLQAAALNETVASELETAAAHFDQLGQGSVTQALRQQAGELRAIAAQSRAKARTSDPPTVQPELSIKTDKQ